jgi:flavodoxin I
MRVALYLGGSHTHTANAGQRIAARLERRLDLRVRRYDLDQTGAAEMVHYDVLLFGCSTWYGGKLPSCWARELNRLQKLDLRDKRVALFGVGNQLRSPDTFQDALGILAEQAEAAGAQLVGQWSAADYTYRQSRALRGDRFAGLALDYENQSDFNELRIVLWTEQLVRELADVAQELAAAAPRRPSTSYFRASAVPSSAQLRP